MRTIAVALLGSLLATSALAAKNNSNGNAWGIIKNDLMGTGCQAAAAPPIIDGLPTFSLMEGSAYSFTPTASDPNCNTLTFSISGKPAWASFSTTKGTLSGTPGAGTAGTYANVVISVSDGAYKTSLPAFTIVVNDNAAPVLSGTPPPSAFSGRAYSFTPSAFDPDGQALRFSVSNRPIWASFDSTSGRLAGTPTSAQAGTYPNIVIAVTDGVESDALDPASIVVEAVNAPPMISGSPAGSVVTGQSYTFTPSASDPEGAPLTFSIQNRPTWASFSTSTGQLSGMPGTANAGEYIGIVISTSDGTSSVSLPAFGIVVSVANRAPGISGTPLAAVTAGQAYRFLPVGTDADGDPLTFSIQNRPTWATFSTATGELSGTPGTASVGLYSNITISVSDGKVSTLLPAFSINVQQVSMGSATLSWQPPTQRTDGTALSNLAGYRILYGTSPGSYSNRVTLDNPGLTSYVVQNLSSGTWYFVVTAFDATGAESDYSSVGSKAIQ